MALLISHRIFILLSFLIAIATPLTFYLIFFDIFQDTVLQQYALILTGVSLFVIVIICLVFYFFVLVPLNTITNNIDNFLKGTANHIPNIEGLHLLGDLPIAVSKLVSSHIDIKQSASKTIASTSIKLQTTKLHLESILNSYTDGIIICDEHSRIVFYNPSASAIFKHDPLLDINRSLYLLCSEAPIKNSLYLLKSHSFRQMDRIKTVNEISFICTTIKGSILNCRIQLLPSTDVSGVDKMSDGFLFIFNDITEIADAQSSRLSSIRSGIKKMRQPLTNLSLNIESMDIIADIDLLTTRKLQASNICEIKRLIDLFEVLASDIDTMLTFTHSFNNIYTADLTHTVAKRLQDKGLDMTIIGSHLWISADVHLLTSLLDFFANKILQYIQSNILEIEITHSDKLVYFNFLWRGKEIPHAVISTWLKESIELLTHDSLAECLEGIGSDVWSHPHSVPGFSIFSLALPLSTSQHQTQTASLPPRPEYVTTMGIERNFTDYGSLGDVKLDELTFVVFDIETTGLNPLSGDEIVSLAALKIVDKGIAVGNYFDELVNPHRDIPMASTRFHGITNEMVKDAKDISNVLQNFTAFAKSAVLVGHNAAFDMTFIRLKEHQAGIEINNPILDIMLISKYLYSHTPEHSLDAIASRLNIEIKDRYAALGDCIITAQIFMKFFYQLAKNGLTTLRQVMDIQKNL